MLVPSVPHKPLKPSLPAGHPNLLSITALFGSVPRPINFDKNKSSDARRERTFSASIHQTSAVLFRSAVPSPSRGLLVPVLFSVAGLPSDGLDLCSRPWFRPWLRPDAACVSSPL